MPALEYDAFRRSVKKGEILPVYYLHGDEDLLKDDGLRDLLAVALDPSTRDFNLDRRRAADLTADDFATLTLTPPMMAARRVVIVTEVEDLQQRRPRAQALRAALLKYLGNPSPDTLLVLVQSADVKPESDLVRLAAAVPFASLTPERLRKWIRHRASSEGLELDDEAAQHLHEVVGDDLPQLAAEISKLKTAVPDRTATAADVSDLVGIRRGETVHDFVDAVTSRRVAAAAGMVRHVLDAPGSTGVRLMIALGTSMTGLALARALLDRGTAPGGAAREIATELFAARPWGLRNYQAEADRWVRDAARWSAAELDAAIADLLRVDRRLKNTTLGGDVEIVTDLVLSMAGAGTVAA